MQEEEKDANYIPPNIFSQW